jgi:tetratricopeptide (TPR) repeat protein
MTIPNLTATCSIILWFICNQLYAQTAAQLIEEGENAFNAKNYKQAEFSFLQATKENPASAEAYTKLGDVRLKQGLYKEAIHSYSEAIKYNRENAKLYYKRGEAYRKLKEASLATADLKKSIELFGSSTEPHISLAKLYIEKKQLLKAKECLQDAFKLEKDNAIALAMEGYIALLENNLVKAHDLIQSVIEKDEKLADANFYLGLYRMKNKEYKEAIVAFQKAIEQDPNHEEAYINKYFAMFEQGQYKKILDECKKLVHNISKNIYIKVIKYIAEYNYNHKDASFTHISYMTQNLFKTTNSKDIIEEYDSISDIILRYTKIRKDESDAEYKTNVVGLAFNCLNESIKMKETYSNCFKISSLFYKIKKYKEAKKYALIALNKAEEKGEKTHDVYDLLAKINQNILDTKGPAIYVMSPITNTRGGIITDTQEEKITVAGTVIDEAGVQNVLINGNPAKLTGNHFEGLAYLKENINSIKIDAYDYLGNHTLHEIEVIKKQVNTELSMLKSLFGRKKAYIIATDDYQHFNNLNNPIKDAKKLKEILENFYGFEVELVLNPTLIEAKAKMRQAMKENYTEKDQVLFFYAGHGEYDAETDRGYIILKDSKKAEDDSERLTWLSHLEIEDGLAKLKCKQVGVIIDACFSGTFDKTLALERGNLEPKDKVKYAREKMTPKTRCFITSGGREYVSDGEIGKHSPFMQRLILALTNVKSDYALITWSDIAKEINRETNDPKFKRPRVGNFTGHEVGGDFLFLFERK